MYFNRCRVFISLDGDRLADRQGCDVFPMSRWEVTYNREIIFLTIANHNLFNRLTEGYLSIGYLAHLTNNKTPDVF